MVRADGSIVRMAITTESRLVIATRESRLALWQARHVQARLQAAHAGLDVELLGMTTEGDRKLDVTLAKIGGKGLFVKELEAALDEGRAQLAVHSLKDVPVELPEGFALAAVLAREDPRDAFVSNDHADIDALPEGAVVGTSSLRRELQIRARWPHLRVEPLRGNLDTRLRKLDEGRYAAIVLARAGLERLGLGARVRQVFEPEQMLPAAAQGALGIEVLSAQAPRLAALLAVLVDAETTLAVAAERALLAAMGGSCTMPIAAYCRRMAPGGDWLLDALYAPAIGAPLRRARLSAPAAADAARMRELGREAARMLA
jgi:hydroxymethylbilane synthase